jgi:protease I
MARVAFIVDDMFEDSEFRVPFDRLRQAGHQVVVVGREANKAIQGKKGLEIVTSDLSIHDVTSEEFDALVIPGGYSPDILRMDPRMVSFTREFFEAGKPLAAVCHAPWMLVEAGVAEGLTVTSWPSLKTDLINAGARWVDREVVEDGHVITSRKPADLSAFSDAILRQLQGQIPDRIPPPAVPAEVPASSPVH